MREETRQEPGHSVIRLNEARILMSDEREFIEAVRRARDEEVRFFSNPAKPERERWVVSEFLTNPGITFEQHELMSPEQDDEVDVLYREARFQVKEIPEPGLRRGDELKADLRRAESATRASELFEVGAGHRPLECLSAYARDRHLTQVSTHAEGRARPTFLRNLLPLGPWVRRGEAEARCRGLAISVVLVWLAVVIARSNQRRAGLLAMQADRRITPQWSGRASLAAELSSRWTTRDR